MKKLIEWEVVKGDIYDYQLQSLKEYQGLYRNDNDNLLNIVSTRYNPIYNSKLEEVVLKLSEDTGFPVESIVEFKGGKRIIANLKASDNIIVDGYEYKDYLVVGNSHDGFSSFFVGHSSKMVRCSNQFYKLDQKYKVRHKGDVIGKIDSISGIFDTYKKLSDETYKSISLFSQVEIDNHLKDSLIKRLVKLDDEERISTRKQNIITDLYTCINKETSELGNNLLGLFNGVTYYTTHVKNNNSLFGISAKYNETAFEFCVDNYYF